MLNEFPLLDFDRSAAKESAAIRAECQKRGRTIDLPDAQIAGIARYREAAVSTGNVSHFVSTGVEIINPWDMS